MSDPSDPVVLDLAQLPRDKIGPFLLLGLEKDADKEQVEANWAKRLIWARKKQIRIPLEDINWAKDVVVDAERRARADAASLNADVIDGVIRRIAKRYGTIQGTARPSWKPLDAEKAVQNYVPELTIPDRTQVHATIVLPAIPEETPAVQGLLDQLVQLPLDPWTLEIPEET